MAAELQAMFTLPKKDKKSSMKPMTMSQEGILYKLEDERDYGKFRVLSEEEQLEETRRSQDIAATLKAMSGHGVYKKNPRRPKSASFVPPQMGATSRQRKIENNEYRKSHTATSNNNTSPPRTLRAHDDIALKQRAGEIGTTVGVAWGDEAAGQEQLLSAVTALQQKHNENMSLIDKLCKERQEMEQQMKRLEDQLRQSRKCNTLHKKLSKGSKATPTSEPTGGDEAFPAEEDSDKLMLPRHATSPPPYTSTPAAGDSQISVLQAADMFGGEKPPNPRPSTSRAGSRSASRSGSRSVRSKSVGGASSGISPQLQSDTDRYLQKKKLIAEREKQEKLEKEKYEQELRDRMLRASKTGGEFVAMKQREAEAAEIRQKRAEREKRCEEAIERKKREKEEAQKRHLPKVDPTKRDTRTWEEIQKDLQEKRRERSELRKQELAASSAYPTTATSASIDKWKTRTHSEPDIKPPEKTFIAQSPEEVAEALRRKQEQWERKLEREKEKLRAAAKHTTVAANVAAMEQRQAVYEAKRQAKLEEERRKEEAEARAAAEEEKRKMERLLKSKVPDASKRLTKAVKDRANKVREEMAKKEAEKKAEEEKMKKKEKSLKIAGAFVKSIVSQNEEKRKGGSFHEVQPTEEELEIAAQERKKEYWNKLRAQRKQYKQVAASKPSLIERHDEEVARRNASRTALNKVAGVVLSASKSEAKDGGDDDWHTNSNDDIFGEDEKLRLGLRA